MNDIFYKIIFSSKPMLFIKQYAYTIICIGPKSGVKYFFVLAYLKLIDFFVFYFFRATKLKKSFFE